MTVPITSPAQNIVGQKFVPLGSGPQAAALAKSDLTEQFVRGVPPGVLSNELLLTIAPAEFDQTSVGVQQILQLTLPIPMPVAVTLGPYIAQSGQEAARFRTAITFPAEARQGNGPTPAPAPSSPFMGRYIIEWGLGSARNYAYTDLAPGSLQIPVTSFVRISAHFFQNFFTGIGPLPVVAGASVYPGYVLSNADAAYTAILQFLSGEASGFLDTTVFPVPFSRSFAAGISEGSFFLHNPVPDARAVLSLFQLSGISFGQWVLTAPDIGGGPDAVVIPTAQTLPHQLAETPTPGGTTQIQLFFVNFNGGFDAGGYITQRVRL